MAPQSSQVFDSRSSVGCGEINQAFYRRARRAQRSNRRLRFPLRSPRPPVKGLDGPTRLLGKNDAIHQLGGVILGPQASYPRAPILYILSSCPTNDRMTGFTGLGKQSASGSTLRSVRGAPNARRYFLERRSRNQTPNRQIALAADSTDTRQPTLAGFAVFIRVIREIRGQRFGKIASESPRPTCILGNSSVDQRPALHHRSPGTRPEHARSAKRRSSRGGKSRRPDVCQTAGE